MNKTYKLEDLHNFLKSEKYEDKKTFTNYPLIDFWEKEGKSLQIFSDKSSYQVFDLTQIKSLLGDQELVDKFVDYMNKKSGQN